MAEHPAPPPGGLRGVEADHPIVDPTKNVLDLVEAANKRQDDLRDAADTLSDEKIRRMEREWINQEKMAILRAEHAKEIRELESKRVDAVREIDVIARNTAAAQALTAIQTLAASTSAEREALRSLVSATATTIAAQTDRIVGAMTDRIAVLEKTSYTGQGKQAVADPQMDRLSSLVEQLARSRATDAGQKQGLSDGWKALIAAVGLLVALNALGVFAKFSTATTAAPQVIYTPAPPGTQLPSTPPSPVPGR